MLSYLTAGWFCSAEPHQLRAEVLDGAWDSAGLLVRAGVPPDALFGMQRLLHRLGPPFGETEATNHQSVQDRMMQLRGHVADETDGQPVLQALMMDGLQSAQDAKSWRALCTHLGHIGLTMAVLASARTAKTDEPFLPALGLADDAAPDRRSAQS